MQLTAKGGNMVVDFYPIKGSTKFMLKIVKFKGIDTVSTKCITKRDFEREVDSRINGYGYDVTDFNMVEVSHNPMMGAC